eukprot:2638660-Amphidinium_carterae.2
MKQQSAPRDLLEAICYVLPFADAVSSPRASVVINGAVARARESILPDLCHLLKRAMAAELTSPALGQQSLTLPFLHNNGLFKR